MYEYQLENTKCPSIPSSLLKTRPWGKFTQEGGVEGDFLLSASYNNNTHTHTHTHTHTVSQSVSGVFPQQPLTLKLFSWWWSWERQGGGLVHPPVELDYFWMRRTPLFLPPPLPPPPPPCRDGHMQFIMQKHPRAAGVGGQEGRYQRCSVSFQHQQVLKVPDSEKNILLCCCVVFQHLYTPRLLFCFDEDRPTRKLEHNAEFSVHIENQRFQTSVLVMA